MGLVEHLYYETGLTVEVIWDDQDSNPLCAANGKYSYEDDGTTITRTLLSDGCEGRSSSANGARLIRPD